MLNITTTQLFSKYIPVGNHTCFMCGGMCDKDYLVKDYIKKTFTAYNECSCLGSEYICKGCIDSMNESTTIKLVTGEHREKQRVRTYSWLITEKENVALTKAHLKELREIINNLPETPFSICISESGQKHNLYRTNICYSKENISVSLEGENIVFTLPEFGERIKFVENIVKCIGKVGFGSIDINSQMKIFNEFGEDILNEYLFIKDKQLTKLALFLSKSKKELDND